MTASSVEDFSSRHIWAFLVLMFLLSWPFWMVSGVLSRTDLRIYDYRWLIAQFGVMGPSLSALIVSGTARKQLRRNSLRLLPVVLFPLAVPGVLVAASDLSKVAEFGPALSILILVVAAAVVLFFSPVNRRLLLPGTGEANKSPGVQWVVFSIVLLPGLFLLAWVCVHLQSGGWEISALQDNARGFAWLVTVVFAHNLMLGGSLGEEIGWRGFLLPALLKKNGPLAASLILGLVWALWHLPIDISTGFLGKGPAAVLLRIVWTIPLTILFTWFYLKSNGNLLVALFLHTSINILPDLGFSDSENAMVFLWVLMVLAALVVSLSSAVFRKEVKT